MIEDPLILLLVFPVLSYAIGSLPFGVIIARSRGVDLRRVGSGNVGATNVARVLGRRWGCLCFALDVTKGLRPVLLVGFLTRREGAAPTVLQQGALLGAGLGAIVGHVFSVFLRLKGGKGVATSLGVVMGVYPYFTFPGLAALGVWIVVTLLSRYVSLGSIAAAIAFVPLFVGINWRCVGDLVPLGVFAGAMVLLIIFRHRTNITRLLQGTESKIGTHTGAQTDAQ